MERQAYLRPSSAAAWSKCSGYAALNAALGTQFVEETDNDIREDGTACHWLAAELWAARPVTAGALAPNGREITDEMFAAVEEYHVLLLDWLVLRDETYIEQLVPVSTVFPGVADGTPDAWAYDSVSATLYVADLKFGFRPVEVWQNPQLIVYAWTLVKWLASQGHEVRTVRLFICQPRCAHRDGTTREWVTGPQQLESLAAALAEAALRCYAPSPPCTVNPACRNCAAAYGCRTLQAAAGAGVDVSYDATPFELSEQQLGYELARLMEAQRHIEHRITGLSTQAEALLRRGKRIPGFEMGRAATRWRWRAGSEEWVQRLAQVFGVQAMAEPKLKSVAKLRDVFPPDVVKLYAEKPDGELKLRLIDPNDAIKKFHSKE